MSDQINMLLNFKDEKQDCPCPEYIREQLLDFHEDLMRHCGNVDVGGDIGQIFLLRVKCLFNRDQLSYISVKNLSECVKDPGTSKE